MCSTDPPAHTSHVPAHPPHTGAADVLAAGTDQRTDVRQCSTQSNHQTHERRLKQLCMTTHHRATPSSEQYVLLRKEVIQPHLPVRLPCYDLVPIASPTFDHSPRKTGWAMSFGCYQLS